MRMQLAKPFPTTRHRGAGTLMPDFTRRGADTTLPFRMLGGAEPIFRPVKGGSGTLGATSETGDSSQHFQHALNFPPPRAATKHDIKRIPGYGLKTAPPETHKPVKHQLLLDCGQLETSKAYLLHKVGPDSFIPTGGTTSAADPCEVSAQIRQIRRPSAGLCSVPVRGEPADPFVHVANVKCDRTSKLFCNSAALFWFPGSGEACARQEPRHERRERAEGPFAVAPPPLAVVQSASSNVVSAYDYDYSHYLFLQLHLPLNNDYSYLIGLE